MYGRWYDVYLLVHLTCLPQLIISPVPFFYGLTCVPLLSMCNFIIPETIDTTGLAAHIDN